MKKYLLKAIILLVAVIALAWSILEFVAVLIVGTGAENDTLAIFIVLLLIIGTFASIIVAIRLKASNRKTSSRLLLMIAILFTVNYFIWDNIAELFFVAMYAGIAGITYFMKEWYN